MMWDGGHGWWGFGPLSMLVFWGLLILLAVALVRWLSGLSGRPPASRERESRAIELLEERYARGEIDRDEFEQKRRDLEA